MTFAYRPRNKQLIKSPSPAGDLSQVGPRLLQGRDSRGSPGSADLSRSNGAGRRERAGWI